MRTTAAGALPATTTVVMSDAATLDLGGNNQTIASLASASFGTSVTASGATLTVGGNNASTTFDGALNGLALVKVGSGTLTLGTVNEVAIDGGGVNGYYLNFPTSTYASGTTINGGTISIELDGALGGASGGVTINGTLAAPSTLEATATFSSARTISLGPASGSGYGDIDVTSIYTLTLSGAIVDSGGFGGLVKIGSGTLVLTNGGNTYSGGTVITAGTLNINSDGTLGIAAANPGITFNGTIASGGGTLQFATSYSGTSLGTPPSGNRSILVTSGSAGTIDTNGNNITYAGTLTIQASGMLTKADSGGAGSFEIDAPPALGNNSALAVTGGTLRLTYGSAATIGASVSASVSSGATMDLAGAASQLSQAVNIVNAGTLLDSSNVNQNLGAVTGAGNTVVNTGGSLTAHQIRQNSLTINGTGKVTLSPSGSGSTTNPSNPNNINFSSAVTTLSIAGAMNAWTGTLDIGNNGLVVAYGSAREDPLHDNRQPDQVRLQRRRLGRDRHHKFLGRRRHPCDEPLEHRPGRFHARPARRCHVHRLRRPDDHDQRRSGPANLYG